MATEQDQRWSAQGRNQPIEIQHLVAHVTDAELTESTLPKEIFPGGYQERQHFIHHHADERGKINCNKIMNWLFSGSIELCRDVDYRRHLDDVLDLAKFFWRENRMSEYKSAGQNGEAVHDYAMTQLRRLGGRKVYSFLCTYNATHSLNLTRCSIAFQRKFQREWIEEIGYGARKYDEAVGDFFELAAMYFLARGWRRHLMSLVIDNCINQYDDEHGRDGTCTLDRAIAADKRMRGSDDYHSVAMTMQHLHRPALRSRFVNIGEAAWQHIADYAVRQNRRLPEIYQPEPALVDSSDDVTDPKDSSSSSEEDQQHRQRFKDFKAIKPLFAGTKAKGRTQAYMMNTGSIFDEPPPSPTPSGVNRGNQSPVPSQQGSAHGSLYGAARGNVTPSSARSAQNTAVPDGDIPIDLASNAPPVNAPQGAGISSEALESNLRSINQNANDRQNAPWIHRAEQMMTMQNQRHLPTLGSDSWTPPYAYQPAQANPAPAIFTHPRYNPEFRHVQSPMDPPFVAEHMSYDRGRELINPCRSHSNRYVREVTDSSHRRNAFEQDEETYHAYNRSALLWHEPDEAFLAAPAISVNGNTNRLFLEELQQIHNSQQANLSRANYRNAKSKGKGEGKKGRGKGKQHAADPNNFSVYHGVDSQCSICQQDFQRGESVYRITCNHLFHEHCWDEYLWTSRHAAECPNCRGPARAKAIFRFVGQTDPETQRETLPQSRHLRRSTSAESYESTHSSMFPESEPDGRRSFAVYMFNSRQVAQWSSSWTNRPIDEYFGRRREQADSRIEDIYLRKDSGTKLKQQPSILVDLGSQINIIGRNTLAEFAGTTEDVKMTRRDTRLEVSGVGSDAAICDYTTELPIAVQFEESDPTLETFVTNVADGCGEDLPAILGSRSMQEKDAVLLLRKGKEILALPGPGGYKIEWSPGTKLLPMQAAPSGHLVIPCRNRDEVQALITKKKAKDAKASQISFVTNHNSTDHSSSSSSTD